MVDVLLVVFLDVSCSRLLQQVITRVHQHAEAVECSYHLGDIGDDRLLFVRDGSHEMVGNAGINAELHLLRVDEHQFQLVWMLLI